jgi:50S ribosomal protein L16 3-hydroxylase
MTYSIGFRAPKQQELAYELLMRLAYEVLDQDNTDIYRDPTQAALARNAKIPDELVMFAKESLQRALQNEAALPCLLGEYLTEPKPNVYFEHSEKISEPQEPTRYVSKCSRMLYNDTHIFINGESFAASGTDAEILQNFADTLALPHNEFQALSSEAQVIVQEWLNEGWIY